MVGWMARPGQAAVALTTLAPGLTGKNLFQEEGINDKMQILVRPRFLLSGSIRRHLRIHLCQQLRLVPLAPLAGDANMDGRVDINDLTVVLTQYGQSSMDCRARAISTATAKWTSLPTIGSTNYNRTSGAGFAAVPEPSALLLIGLGFVSLVAYTWRRRR